jgi:hypothetical protein
MREETSHLKKKREKEKPPKGKVKSHILYQPGIAGEKKEMALLPIFSLRSACSHTSRGKKLAKGPFAPHGERRAIKIGIQRTLINNNICAVHCQHLSHCQ